MDYQKPVGIALIAVGAIVAAVTYFVKQRAEAIINVYANQTGTCYINGTCLHSTAQDFSIFGWILAVLLVAAGIYILVNLKKYKTGAAEHHELAKTVEEIKKQTDKDEFDVFLAAFTDQEKLLLKAIKEQDGILQSTLRYRVGMSKAALSQKLTEFEKKGIISRKEEGKTNKVFLRKRF